MSFSSSLHPAEISKFNQLAPDWWNPEGPLKSLHQINPTRLKYIKTQVCLHFERPQGRQAFQGLKILDVGCGAGLLSEPLCRLGADVTGLDGAKENVLVAQEHAQKMGLSLSYRHGTVEDLFPQEAGFFDVVIGLEIIEHVTNPQDFLKTCFQLVKPGGLFIVSTLNRTLKSYGLGIVAAEYILGWVPKGTHQWRQFLKPSEIALPLQREGGRIKDITGMTFQLFRREWALTRDTSINYFLTASKGNEKSNVKNEK